MTNESEETQEAVMHEDAIELFIAVGAEDLGNQPVKECPLYLIPASRFWTQARKI